METGSPPVSSRSGWRERADTAGDGRSLDRSPGLTASEIGAFACCPQAWYLQRRGIAVTPEADARRRAGQRAHRAIGRQTDALRLAASAQRLVLLAIVLLVVLLLLGVRALP